MFHRRHGKKTARTEEEEEDDTFPVYSTQSQEDMNAMVSALSQVMGSDETDSTNNHGDMSYSSSVTPNQPPPNIQQSPGHHILSLFYYTYIALDANH